ncbi:ABC transporter substrate-binding protein [Geotoga petraea]|jgi:peptide/nickel transport system substrate-binding protein|uniref:ABC transporter substrate-binding protein n=1 Tax=Geotoga petraea TaxID=28234 RepID=A0A4Z0W5M6_9BACT|nr:ABC transporter substrate-binding protein [Geotoga petraea]MDK2946533.1 peptide/nickel transport system substrate-binding protein [Geotoga sp.]TGG88732.1 ABC transporter substrate-binding protein [Geotoga petraea]
MKKIKTILLFGLIMILSISIFSANEPKGEAIYGGEVVVAIPQDPDYLDPHRAAASGTYEIMFNVFEGLLKPDSNGGARPAVAKGYEVSDDGLTYTFEIRDDVYFHNGEKVTLEDIKYSYERLMGVNGEALSSDFEGSVESVKIIQPNKIRFELKETDTTFLFNFTESILPKSNDGQHNINPIGTGPFKFVEYLPGQRIVIEKFDKYWDEKLPYLDKVEFRIITDPQASLIAFQAGEIDMIPRLGAQYINLIGNNGYIISGEQNLIQILALNLNREPFDDVRVRRAMSYAIDKDLLIQAVADGYGTKLGSNMSPVMGKYFKEGLADKYSVNIEKAVELLEEAGYPNGFETTITVPSNYKFHVDTAQVIVEMLKQIGVKAKIEQIEWGVWLDRVYAGRDFDSTIIGFTGKLSAYDILKRYISDYSRNFLNYNNPEYDRLLKAAVKETDTEKSIELYKQAQVILSEDLPAIFLMDPNFIVALQNNLAGYTLYPLYIQDMAVIHYVK